MPACHAGPLGNNRTPVGSIEYLRNFLVNYRTYILSRSGFLPASLLATWDLCSANRHIAHERKRLIAEAREIQAHSTMYMLFALIFQSADHLEEEVQIVLPVFISIKQRIPLTSRRVGDGKD